MTATYSEVSDVCKANGYEVLLNNNAKVRTANVESTVGRLSSETGLGQYPIAACSAVQHRDSE